MKKTNVLKLNVGCGEKKLKEYINIDIDPKHKPEYCFDASKIENYKMFDNEDFELIESSHFLEHTPNPEEVVKEWHRLLKKMGILKIKVPHFSRGFTNPTHQRGFDLSWVLHFNKNNKYSTYAGVEFTPIKIRLKWIAFLEHYPTGKTVKCALALVNGIINFFANLNPYFCSRVWCFWVGGFEEIELWLRKEK